jgi:TonB family protein
MYQVIDDQDEDEAGAPARWSILPFIIGTILAALVFFLVWLFSPGQQIAPGQTIETPASRSAYLKAISESNPAVRRARLLDYQNAYPDSDRTDAVEDQLDVINAAELRDWDNLFQTIYNDSMALDAKRSVMEIYETRWNGRLLGGRGEELVALKEKLDETKVVDSLPDRRLEAGKSPIPENIPSDTLAGAPPRLAVTTPIFVPPPPPPPAPTIRRNTDVIEQPSVRRNVSPSYPRKAKRRKIGAVVTVSMNIGEDGRVDNAELVMIEAERYQKDFTRAALRAAKRTRFNPKTVNGRPVPARDVRKRYIFKSN